MDPKNPTIFEARDAKSEYIVYFSQDEKMQWHFERVSDGAVLHRGSLEEMLALLPQYPNSRRATWAEDMHRWTPSGGMAPWATTATWIGGSSKQGELHPQSQGPARDQGVGATKHEGHYRP